MKYNFLWLGVFLAVAFALYWPLLGFDFIQLDESALITNNLSFLNKSSSIGEIFRHDVNYPSAVSAFYRPVLVLTFMLNSLGGVVEKPLFYLTNIIIHGLAVWVFFLLLCRLEIKRSLALFFSLILAVHPALVQALAWIPGRNDSLLALWSALSFLFFLNYLKKRDWLSLVTNWFFFGLALFTKETALMLLPLSAYFLYLYPSHQTLSTKNKIRWGTGVVIIVLGWAVLRQLALPAGLSLPGGVEIISTVFRNLGALLSYLGKTIFPFSLSVFPVWQVKSLAVFWGAVVLFLFFIFRIRTGPFSVLQKFGLAWFLLFLLPVLATYDRATEMVFFEHRLYLPLWGLLIFLADQIWIKKVNFFSKKYISVTLVVLALFIWLNFKHQKPFAGALDFWQSAVQDAPLSARTHRSLATAYALDKQWPEAETYFKRALELNPREIKLHNNLALVYVEQGSYDRAEEEFKKELEIDPRSTLATHNLGRLYARNGNFSEAEKWFLKTLELNPAHAKAHQDLAVIYFQEYQDLERAVYHIQRAIGLGAMIHPELLKVLELYEQSK